MKSKFGARFLITILVSSLISIAILFATYKYSQQSLPKQALPLPTTPTSQDLSTIIDTNQTSESTDDLKAKPAHEHLGYCLHLPILMYHHIQPMKRAEANNQKGLTVEPQVFDQQLAYLLKQGYHTIGVMDLVNALKNKTTLPAKSIIITLDDGYSDNNEFALPTGEKYKFLLNFMIPTGFIDKGGYLGIKTLQAMDKSKYAAFYPHGVNHLLLAFQTDEVVNSETKNSIATLQKDLGKIDPVYTYPSGSYNDHVIDMLKNNGYVAAFSTISGATQCDSEIYSLERIRIGNYPMTTYGF